MGIFSQSDYILEHQSTPGNVDDKIPQIRLQLSFPVTIASREHASTELEGPEKVLSYSNRISSSRSTTSLSTLRLRWQR